MDEMADIFRKHIGEYKRTHKLSYEQSKAVSAIMDCRTPALGGVMKVCPHCKELEFHYKACKNRHCPKCGDIVLMRHYYSKKRGVVVDECPSCGGFWLDAGELEQIRSEREALHAEEASKAILSRLDVKYQVAEKTR